MRRLAEGRPEGPDEMSRGNGRHLREAGDVKRLGVRAVDCVPSPQHAAIKLFHGPSHPTMLREGGGSHRSIRRPALSPASALIAERVRDQLSVIEPSRRSPAMAYPSLKTMLTQPGPPLPVSNATRVKATGMPLLVPRPVMVMVFALAS